MKMCTFQGCILVGLGLPDYNVVDVRKLVQSQRHHSRCNHLDRNISRNRILTDLGLLALSNEDWIDWID